VGSIDRREGRVYAAIVVAALSGEYRISKDRLTPCVAGMAAPAASSATEEGRSKNQRVAR
jgi:hypothetical protein